MAQMRNNESAAVQQNSMMNVQNTQPIQQQRFDVIQQSNLLKTEQSFIDSHSNSLDQVGRRYLPCITKLKFSLFFLKNIGGVGGVLIDVMSQKKQTGNSTNYANSIIKERIVEDGHIELEVILCYKILFSFTTKFILKTYFYVNTNYFYVNYIDYIFTYQVPDNIVGAVLGPRAKTLIEMQQLSGAKIEV